MFNNYFLDNFILVCVSLVLIIISIQRFRQNTKISVCTICTTAIAIALSFIVDIQEFARNHNNLYLALTCGILGYVLRPLCIYILILMSEKFIPKKYLWLTILPLVLNLVVYLFAYIPGTRDIIFGYDISTYDGQLHFVGGPLRFTSHIISALYLAFLIYISIFNLRVKHLTHGLAILICSVFVVTAVVLESFFNPNGDLELLNVTIVVSTIIYFLFLYMESTQVDSLTGLFNRETYYRDVLKMGGSATGVIQFDMNGLKYINDNLGHLEGDKALTTIAETILKSVKRSMYAYRLGGDEFVVIVNRCEEEEIRNTVQAFKDNLKKTSYHCSVGYAYRQDKNMNFTDLLKEAEKKMYIDKAEFYKSSSIERRKADKA